MGISPRQQQQPGTDTLTVPVKLVCVCPYFSTSHIHLLPAQLSNRNKCCINQVCVCVIFSLHIAYTLKS